ncbi:polyprenyl synthetase family protein [Parvularcula bermudensis HTCC2503]|uniref:Polyprenyl synthetase family protein n=2 Tax=Parvularcula TaxID=208215 RepID=E0TED0_PARBH|nr:polyprenyl synthetase family protein [Parvularcula bermudensis HTCC2503]
MLSGQLESTNQVILDHLASSVPLIPEVARHLIAAGGKRLRPLMTLAAAELCGETGEGPRLLAGAVELIHAATLLHDDVVDESALRRGLRTANIVFGNKESVLVGDFLFARAFELMVRTGSIEVLGILSKASCIIAEGEVLQLTTSQNLETPQTIYLDVISAKTAALFAAAAEAGAVVAGGDAEKVAAMRAYGLNFGIAYQLVDDALDYQSSGAVLGKTAGDDFREGKMTLPVIRAYAASTSDEERQFWQRTIRDKDQRPDDFARANELMRRDRIVEACLQEARGYAEAAASSLAVFPVGDLRGTLEDLAIGSAERTT